MSDGGRRAVLALDGGGVRGVITVAFLERIEALLTERAGRPVRLYEYFDLVGGTSTGAIIAGAIALGMSAAEIRDFYLRLAPRVFRRSRLRLLGLQSVFDSGPLKSQIAEVCGERTLESPDLKTGLAIVSKRMDTGSAWIVTNNPRSKFWEDPPDRGHIGNRNYRLADVLRASTAAPYYFAPERIPIIEGQEPGLFVDGGVTPHNNPSLAMLQLVTIPGYGYSWPTGADRLLILSIGTGSYRERLDARSATLDIGLAIRERANRVPMGEIVRAVIDRIAIKLAYHALVAMITDGMTQVLTTMQSLGRTARPWVINSEIGDLGGYTLTKEPLFTFARYDVRLERNWLEDELQITVDEKELRRLRLIDDAGAIPRNYEIARRAAERQVTDEDISILIEAKNASSRPK